MKISNQNEILHETIASRVGATVTLRLFGHVSFNYNGQLNLAVAANPGDSALYQVSRKDGPEINFEAHAVTHVHVDPAGNLTISVHA